MDDQKMPRNIALAIGKSHDGKLRDIHLSPRQSEVLIVGLPILFIWAILSTGLYIHQSISVLSSRDPSNETKHLSQDVATSVTVKAHESPPSVFTKEKLTKSAESTTVAQPPPKTNPSKISIASPHNTLLRNDVVIGNIFRVKTSIVAHAPGTNPQLHLLLSNSTGSLEEGTLWAQVSAIDKQGKEITFESARGMTIDSEGKTDNPRKGSRYSIRHERERTIDLQGPKAEVQRYTKVLLGISRAPSGEQIIGKTEL